MPQIIFSDEYITVCVKKPGQISEMSDSEESLPRLVFESTGIMTAPVNRLDKPVGGVIILANNGKAAAAFSRLVTENKIRKTYLAVCEGLSPSDGGRLDDLLFFDRKKRKSFVVDRIRGSVKRASLEYEALGRADGKTLLRITLITGRTHQIRAQLGSRRLPVCGDGKYGGREKLPSPALFSWKTELTHPFTDKALTFTASPDFGSYPWSLFKTESEMYSL